MTHIIACEVLYDELRAALDPRDDVRITWVEAALHTDLDELELQLRRAIIETAVHEKIIMLYGGGCLPWMDELLDGTRSLQYPGRDCIDLLLEEHVREAFDNMFLLTPGWVRAWPSIMQNMGWSEVDVRINLGRYKRVVVFDPGIRPLTDDEILEFFDLSGVYVELVSISLLPFRRRIEALLNM